MIIEHEAHITDAGEKNICSVTKTVVAETACKEFYENFQRKDMQRALKYLSYEDQLNLLQVRTDCIDLLIQLYKDYNKGGLLVAHYVNARMFYEAAESEVKRDLKVKYADGCSADVR